MEKSIHQNRNLYGQPVIIWRQFDQEVRYRYTTVQAPFERNCIESYEQV